MVKVGQMMAGKWRLLAASGVILAGIASPATAKDCSELGALALDNGKVTAATLVPAGSFTPPAGGFGPPPGVANAAYKTVPAFCRVQAVMTPTSDSNIKVEIWLPAEGWNGKLVGIGNGIWAGQLSYAEMGNPVSRGFAAVTTDTGHTGSGLTAEWAVGHPEKLVDFGHRAVHLMTVAAKQAIKSYYGSAAKYALWNSCSTGGRQGLMAAYRYPEDFDAISAMAPANPMTDLMTQSMWAGFQPKRTPGAGLTPALLAMVHKAAVAKCDAKDGLADGLIGRPEACDFKPAALLCKAGETANCLSADQVGTMEALYGGVRDPRTGKALLPGWPIGSEAQMSVLMMGAEPFPVATDYFRLLVHGDQKGWDWRQMDYGKEVGIARTYGADMLNVPPQGLAAFFKRGGKLLLSHGWTDGLIPANNTVAFYRAMTKALPAQSKGLARLFMLPGMDHCSGGEGPSSIDTLSVLDNWLSTGVAPERIIAKRGGAAMPGAPAPTPMSRPLCPFPLYARYNGTGSTDSEENFTCTPPQK